MTILTVCLFILIMVDLYYQHGQPTNFEEIRNANLLLIANVASTGTNPFPLTAFATLTGTANQGLANIKGLWPNLR